MLDCGRFKVDAVDGMADGKPFNPFVEPDDFSVARDDFTRSRNRPLVSNELRMLSRRNEADLLAILFVCHSETYIRRHRANLRLVKTADRQHHSA